MPTNVYRVRPSELLPQVVRPNHLEEWPWLSPLMLLERAAACDDTSKRPQEEGHILPPHQLVHTHALYFQTANKMLLPHHRAWKQAVCFTVFYWLLYLLHCHLPPEIVFALSVDIFTPALRTRTKYRIFTKRAETRRMCSLLGMYPTKVCRFRGAALLRTALTMFLRNVA